MDNSGCQIFISYAREDQPAARQIYEGLIREGFSVWFDEVSLLPGEDFKREICQAIKNCSFFIALLSKNSVNKRGFVNREMREAIDQFKSLPDGSVFIIPARLDDCQPGFKILSKINWVDLFPSYITGFEKIRKVIHKRIPVTPPPPANEIPGLGIDLPPGSNVPFSRNVLFTGRADELAGLAAALVNSPVNDGVTVSQARAAATGDGGMGKTQLAIEFCYRYGRCFEGVHWLDASGDIAAGIAGCGEKMGLSNWPEKQSDQVNITLEKWQEGGPRLIVFDNLEDVEKLRKWLPRMGGNRLLITTRSEKIPPEWGMLKMPLDVLSVEESRQFLRRLAVQLITALDAELDELTEKLGHLPLALDLAGRYLVARNLSVKEYMQAIENTPLILSNTAFIDWSKTSPTGHPVNLKETFSLSWEQLQDSEDDALAKQIFFICGHCVPNAPIPYELLAATSSSRENLAKALKRLGELGLVRSTSENEVLVHPLLGEYARALNIAGKDDILEKFTDALILYSEEAYKSGWLTRMRVLSVHLEKCAYYAEGYGIKQAGSLWYLLGCIEDAVGNQLIAREHVKKALWLAEKNLGKNHLDVARGLDRLGWIEKDLGSFKDAEKCFEMALRIVEKNRGKEKYVVTKYLNSLGWLRKEMGKYSDAERLFTRALIIDQKRKENGKAHPDLARDLNNLGWVMIDRGRITGKKTDREKMFIKAYDYFKNALDIDRAFYTNGHTDIVRDANSLGIVKKKLGDMIEAKKYFEMALDIDQKNFGTDHPRMAMHFNNLAGVLQELGELDKAFEYYSQALNVDENIYGGDHPSVARDLNNLGIARQEQGKLEDARVYFERALQIDSYIYEMEHPAMIRDLYNLGILCLDMFDLQDAVNWLDLATKIDIRYIFDFRDKIGPGIAFNNLGVVLYNNSHLARSRECFYRALRFWSRYFPSNHKYIDITQMNLKEVIKTIGNLQTVGGKSGGASASSIVPSSLPVAPASGRTKKWPWHW